MKQFQVTFLDVIEAETEADAYGEIIEMSRDVANNVDVTAFQFEELGDRDTS